MPSRSHSMTADLVGGAGVAAATVTERIPGPCYFLGLACKYTSQPVTTDVTLVCVDPTGLEKTLFTRSNSNVDVPMHQIMEVLRAPDGTPVAQPNVGPPLISGHLRLNVAGGDAVAAGVRLAVILSFR